MRTSNTSELREGFGWFFTILGAMALLAFCFVFSFYKFQHETLTETQLTIWCLQNWWAWLPSSLVAVVGITMLAWNRLKGEA